MQTILAFLALSSFVSAGFWDKNKVWTNTAFSPRMTDDQALNIYNLQFWNDTLGGKDMDGVFVWSQNCIGAAIKTWNGNDSSVANTLGHGVFNALCLASNLAAPAAQPAQYILNLPATSVAYFHRYTNRNATEVRFLKAHVIIIKGYNIAIVQFQQTVKQMQDQGIVFYDLATPTYETFFLQQATTTGVSVGTTFIRPIRYQPSYYGEYQGGHIAKLSVSASGRFAVMENYGGIRTRYLNMDNPSVILTLDKPPKLFGLSALHQTANSTISTRVDWVRDCFIENVFDLNLPRCLDIWKYITFRDFNIAAPTLAAYQASMANYTIPPFLEVDKPSATWPEPKFPFDHYVDVLGLSE